MYLNYQLVPGFQIILRNGEERDCEYLASVFSEVWTGIPDQDRAAILSRGYGHITVDIQRKARRRRMKLDYPQELKQAGDMGLSRIAVDTFPRNVLVHFVARDFAKKVDDFEYPKTIAGRKPPHQNARQRLVSILERWGYPARAEPELTRADELRIQANMAIIKSKHSHKKPEVQEPEGNP